MRFIDLAGIKPSRYLTLALNDYQLFLTLIKRINQYMNSNQTSEISGRVLELLMLLDLKTFPPQQYLDAKTDNYSQYVCLSYKVTHALKQPEPLALSAFLK